MRVVIHTTDGGELNIEQFAAGTLMDLLESFEQDNVRLLTFALDDGLVYIPKTAVTRIDTYDEQ